MRLRKRWGRAERHAGCARRSPAEATEDAGSIPATSTPWTACARGEHSPFGVSDDVGGAEPPHTPHGATGSPTSTVACGFLGMPGHRVAGRRTNLTFVLGALPVVPGHDRGRGLGEPAGQGWPVGQSIRDLHGLLSAALAAALVRGQLAANPRRGMRLPRRDHRDDETVFLTLGECALLLSEIP